jgi:hypothetical protein
MIYSYSENNYEEYQLPLEICNKLIIRLQSVAYLSITDVQELQGFILYLLQYITNYEYYVELKKQKKASFYFKSVFFTKPRTNPAVLYQFLNKIQQDALVRLLDILSYEYNVGTETPSWVNYLREIIPKMKNKDCVYTKGKQLGYTIPNALYNYDKEDDVNTFIGMEEYEKSFIKNIPCVNPYDPADKLDSAIPKIVYDGAEWDIEGTAPAQIWEWKSTGDKMVAFEFRDLTELVYISLLMKGVNPDLMKYQYLFKNDMVNPTTLKDIISIIFTFFEILFHGKNKQSVKKRKKSTSVKKEKKSKARHSKQPKKSKTKKSTCKSGQVIDKKSNTCRDRKRCKNGFRRNSQGECIKK